MSNLQQKLSYNHQRGEFTKFIEALPSGIKALFSDVEQVYREDFAKLFKYSPHAVFSDGKIQVSEEYNIYLYNDFDQIEHVRQAIAESRLRFNGAVHVQLDQCVYLFKQFSEYELLRIMSACGSHFSSVHVDDGIRGYIVSQY